MYTFHEDERVHRLVSDFHASGWIAAAGVRIQSFRVQDEAQALPGTGFVVGATFRVRDPRPQTSSLATSSTPPAGPRGSSSRHWVGRRWVGSRSPSAASCPAW
jgi:hypothetical protein